MKIALFTETFLPSTDGIVTRLLATIDYLIDSGHALAIIAPYGAPKLYKGIPILSISGFPYPFYPQLKFCPPSRSMGAFLREFQPDLIHVINPVVLGLGGIFYAKKMRIPLVASFHTHLAKYAQTYNLPFLAPVAWHYLRFIHNLASVNLATSQAMVRELSGRRYRNVRWWEGGVDTELFHPRFQSETMRSTLTDGHPENFILLYVGRLAHEKNLAQIRPLLDAIPNLSVAFIGDGPARIKLGQAFSGSKAKFFGFLHGEELASAYASADAFIFPSTTETLGLVLLEAMSSGLPVIAAESAPTIELFQNQELGIVYRSGNMSSLIEAVRLLMAQPDLRNRMSLNARSAAQTRNWIAPTQRLVHYYGAAMRAHRIFHAKSSQSHARVNENYYKSNLGTRRGDEGANSMRIQ